MFRPHHTNVVVVDAHHRPPVHHNNVVVVDTHHRPPVHHTDVVVVEPHRAPPVAAAVATGMMVGAVAAAASHPPPPQHSSTTVIIEKQAPPVVYQQPATVVVAQPAAHIDLVLVAEKVRLKAVNKGHYLICDPQNNLHAVQENKKGQKGPAFQWLVEPVLGDWNSHRVTLMNVLTRHFLAIDHKGNVEMKSDKAHDSCIFTREPRGEKRVILRGHHGLFLAIGPLLGRIKTENNGQDSNCLFKQKIVEKVEVVRQPAAQYSNPDVHVAVVGAPPPSYAVAVATPGYPPVQQQQQQQQQPYGGAYPPQPYGAYPPGAYPAQPYAAYPPPGAYPPGAY